MRTVRAGAFTLPCSPAVAIALFTPEGEREWADGWRPEYLSGASDEVGAVWRTSVHEEITWVTTDRDADRLRYARISSDGTAGLVDVRCTAADDGTTVDVTYDLTAVTAAGRDALSRFAAGFADLLHHWHQATLSVLQARGGQPHR